MDLTKPSLNDEPDATLTVVPSTARAVPGQNLSVGGLVGRFEVRGLLGIGGMGRVYEAWDPDLGRNVAIKLVNDPSATAQERLARFVAEARVTGQLQHPNIVPVYDMGVTEDGRFYFVMKKVEGQALDKLIKRLRRGDPVASNEWGRHRLLSVFVQICNAVAYAHSRDVLHRDLKPGNIMIGPFGEVLVLDWGLSRVIGEELPQRGTEPVLARSGSAISGRVSTDLQVQTRVGVTLGTPGYMSPEQARAELQDLDGRTDIWSLGAILYELLTFERAIDHESARGLTYRDASDAPDPRRAAGGRIVADDIAEVCIRAMAPRQDDRYPDASALARDVEGFLDGNRRREEALELITSARQYRAAVAAAQRRHVELQDEAQTLLAEVPSSAPEELKAPGWEKEAEAEVLADEASRNEARFVQTVQAALERAPGLAEAHGLLADYYHEKHVAAEVVGDARAAAGLDLLLRAHARGRYDDYLRGEGTFDLITDPAGAMVEVLQYVEWRKRLVARHFTVLGPTPLRAQALPIGSYLLVMRADGHTPVRYPIQIQRQGHHGGVAPDEADPRPIVLPESSALDEGEVYIPSGWCQIGGDSKAAGSLPGRRLWINAFVMQRHPVTHGEWIDYLNDLVRHGREAEALNRAPRENSARDDDLGALLYDRNDGQFVLRPSNSGGLWSAAHPVCNVDWSSAAAYAEWRANMTGLAWRLPSELEWEKAARGVDGRPLPWGSHHDHSWCLTLESQTGTPSPQPIGAFPLDESPYGVCGLAGGIRDWCLEEFVPDGPEVTPGGRLVVKPPRPDAATHTTRGGAWSLPAWVSRAACRGYHPPIRLGDLGLRLVRTYSPA